MRIKALTIWQPWASLIAVEAKRIETRSWHTRYRGLLAIHAAKRWRPEEQDLTWERDYQRIFHAYDLDGAGLPLGSIVAVAKLTAVVRSEKALLQLRQKQMLDEILLGDYRNGRFGFCLEQVATLPQPVPAKGAQGFWWWDVPMKYQNLVRSIA